MCAAIAAMAHKLDLCCSTAPLTMKSVDELIQKGAERSELCRDDFTSTYESLAAAMRNQDTNNIRRLLQVTDILDIIDSAWEAEMTNQAVNAFGCVEYAQKDDVRENISKDLHPLLDGFACRFKFLSLNHLDPSYGLPVLTQSPLRALGHHLERIPAALQEVSSGLSYTQAAIDALTRHEPTSLILLVSTMQRSSPSSSRRNPKANPRATPLETML
ncbi:hypothetical protein PAXRUDRAFT_390292 [Paxillus rubicundulus Ve08.2h10]|uniref:Uncharacterized protein n=1 Tax=Paxillus rubicundulus Ve08.2h10 TaxID=930991 RepID=A0A0D0C217_9AGAM|nr:hypothetical protein PAXRUDRAFT_390292 [Paxillus rubicundulus Ve08.2h10]